MNGLLIGQQDGGSGVPSDPLAFLLVVIFVMLVVLFFVLHKETKQRRKRP
jgi:preprotein translocase subunit YajC